MKNQVVEVALAVVCLLAIIAGILYPVAEWVLKMLALVKYVFS